MSGFSLSERVRSGELAAFEAWKQSDPLHAKAAGRMIGLIERVQSLRYAVADTRPLHATLEAVGLRPSKRRSQLKRCRWNPSGLVIGAVFASGWLVLQTYPPAHLLADISTATGQPKTLQLADNTRITLKGASAVNCGVTKGREQLTWCAARFCWMLLRILNSFLGG